MKRRYSAILSFYLDCGCSLVGCCEIERKGCFVDFILGAFHKHQPQTENKVTIDRTPKPASRRFISVSAKSATSSAQNPMP
ncbi:hypothetical protein A946_00530 [Methylacidiphilum kamchatkense Kam1]|uniref:Secreted protein n=1 Tax=Methylacidiphilum kamchatkense Kam1 TaxID=1202785 RepID=A0ABR4ZYM5_9BACT|nr:hypothetical protein A946_00530 [Methylacidiphilum kamchatkense Kam1]